MNNNNSNNNNKYNFNYEEVGEIKDLLEAVIIDLDFIKSYARIIEDKLEDIRTGHHLDQRKDITTDLTTMLALEYNEAQRDLA